MQKSTIITAHSGCEGTLQDSLESVSAGIQCGAGAVEVDVRLSAEGELVLSHDERPGGYAGCATLPQAMQLAAQANVVINCDVKETRAVADVLAVAAALGIQRKKLVLTGSMKPGLLLSEPDIVKNARVWLNIEELLYWYFEKGRFGNITAWPGAHPFEVLMQANVNLEEWLAYVVQDFHTLQVEGLNMPANMKFGDWPAWIRLVMGQGIPVSVWTVNDEEAMQRFFAMGVLNLTTLQVKKAVAVQKRLQGT